MCITDCVSYYIKCIKCDSFLHFKFDDSNGNTPPAYIFLILKIACIYAIHISLTSLLIYLVLYDLLIYLLLSQFTLNAISDISAKLDEIKIIVDNTYTITNTHKKHFAGVLIHSIELNTIYDNINKSDNH